jgi:hypothetical protein
MYNDACQEILRRIAVIVIEYIGIIHQDVFLLIETHESAQNLNRAILEATAGSGWIELIDAHGLQFLDNPQLMPEVSQLVADITASVMVATVIDRLK